MNSRPEVPAQFERTTCACSGCVACCKQQPGSLVLADWQRIKDKLGLSEKEMRGKFVASKGSLVHNFLTGVTRRIGTIVPRYRKKLGRCVFLDANDRCEIHDVAPFGCSYFDTHMDGHDRSQWAVEQHDTVEYQELRNTLPLSKHYKPFTRPMPF
jgi:Fe-S-cluster containining protein